MKSPYFFAAILFSTAVTSCYYSEDCFTGILPFDGQTNVSLDASVSFKVSPINKAYPALRNLSVLHEKASGKVVEVEVSIDTEQNIVIVTPTSPLKPNTKYVAEGLILPETRHHMILQNNAASYHLSTSRVTFSTASMPTLLGHFHTATGPTGYDDYYYYYKSEQEQRIGLVFSEPVDPQDMEDLNFSLYPSSSQNSSTQEEEDITAVFIEMDEALPHVAYFDVSHPAASELYVSGTNLRSLEGDGAVEDFTFHSTSSLSLGVLYYLRGSLLTYEGYSCDLY